MDNAVTLIVPTFNERDNITPLVERVDKALSGYQYRILFIDDNSRDGTAEAVKALSSKYPVEVIVRKDKRGLASAVVDGIGYAKTETIGVMDADLQHPPEVLPRLIEAIKNGADIVVGSRYVAGGGLEGWSTLRKIISKGATVIAHVLLPATRNIKDPMSGLFMFRKSALEGVELNPMGYKILLEVLMLSKHDRVAEVPYIFKTRSRGESKLNSKQQIEYLKHVFSLMKRTGELVRFGKFIIVGASGTVVNLGVQRALVEWAHLGPIIPSQIISIETSIITNFLFNNYFTFGDRRSRTAGSFLASFGRFNLVSLVALGVNLGIAAFFYTIVHLDYTLSNLIGIIVAFVINYFLSNAWAWNAGSPRTKATR